jgi:hypothetical protein
MLHYWCLKEALWGCLDTKYLENLNVVNFLKHHKKKNVAYLAHGYRNTDPHKTIKQKLGKNDYELVLYKEVFMLSRRNFLCGVPTLHPSPHQLSVQDV